MEKFLWKEVIKFLQKNFMLISNKECASLICIYIKKKKPQNHAGVFLLHTNLHFLVSGG